MFRLELRLRPICPHCGREYYPETREKFLTEVVLFGHTENVCSFCFQEREDKNEVDE